MNKLWDKGIILILIPLLIACASTSSQTAEVTRIVVQPEEVTRIVLQPVEVTRIVLQTIEVTREVKIVVTPTVIKPSNTPTPKPTNTPKAPEIGQRGNPVPLGRSMQLVQADKKEFEVSIVESFRGDEAWARIKKANQFNDEAQPDMEYILVRIQVNYTKGPGDEPLNLDQYNFKTVSQGQFVDIPSIVEPEPQFKVKYFPGANGGGWAAYEVFADDPNPLLVIGADSAGVGGFYFSVVPR
ncbi:MAG: hypothetical protein HY326_05470 [Chloroflexi bacterium]|nr:hypothetical protein [Chloroflexota bacterium]